MCVCVCVYIYIKTQAETITTIGHRPADRLLIFHYCSRCSIIVVHSGIIEL